MLFRSWPRNSVGSRSRTFRAAAVVEVKASSLFEAVAQAVKLKGGHIATDGFRPTDQGPCLRTKGRRRGKAEGFHGVARPKKPLPPGEDKSYEDKGATWRKEDALNRAND